MGRKIIVIKVKWTCDLKGCDQHFTIVERGRLPFDSALPGDWHKLDTNRRDPDTGHSFPRTYYFCSTEHMERGKKILEKKGIRIYSNWNTNA